MIKREGPANPIRIGRRTNYFSNRERDRWAFLSYISLDVVEGCMFWGKGMYRSHSLDDPNRDLGAA
jgi:hypothetical protein